MKKLSILLLGLAASVCVNAADMKDLKIYVNPGHGGHDSDDRWVEVPPFTNQDPNGFWESNSNLVKGLDLRDMLESFGANVMMSRTTNTTEDDRDLHEIGYEANAYAADFFFSIHSNATGTSAKKNQPLMLYRGFTDDPVSPEAKVMSGILNKHLLENRITSWSSESQWLAGDYDFLLHDPQPLKQQFYYECVSRILRPKVYVDYEREPLVLESGDVRITFDRDVRGAYPARSMFSTDLTYHYVLEPGKLIMEVKYTEFLPRVVKQLLPAQASELTAFSKYTLCCDTINYMSAIESIT